MPFIDTGESKAIRDALLHFAQLTLPTSQVRELQYCVVRGAMGVGKTRTTYRAVSEVCSKVEACQACYIRLDDYQSYAQLDPDGNGVHPSTLLASVLLYGF